MKKKPLLSANTKMKKSSIDGVPVYLRNFDLPSQVTCFNRKLCAGKNCYAFLLEQRFPNYKASNESKLEASMRGDFVPVMGAEINATPRGRKGQRKIVRIHASGDFYDMTYLLKWVAIMMLYPEVTFYAYTKMVSMIKGVRSTFGLPSNFVVIFSYGGKEDHLIDPAVDRHAFVFKDRESFDAGYADASDNDLVAIGNNHRIGLAYHAKVRWEDSLWSKVVRNEKSVAL
jgi:hypothetical protein